MIYLNNVFLFNKFNGNYFYTKDNVTMIEMIGIGLNYRRLRKKNLKH